MAKFLMCRICKNIAGMVEEGKGTLSCCGESMNQLVANTVDASKEKHVPVAAVNGNTVTVTVGSAPHPMEAAHYISFIYLETENGGQRKKLEPGDAPTAEFSVINDKPRAAYEYCNLHGLWKVDI